MIQPRGLSLSTCLSSRPTPTRSQATITASRPIISRGRGEDPASGGPGQQEGLGLRCRSAAATPRLRGKASGQGALPRGSRVVFAGPVEGQCY